ncbi:MAG: helix-turn-helix transcriptional regulator [Acidobacteria bacterium]|nr:helix-turn-helix transcriptional regulator [Acidobacteriota bacterium]
MRIELVRARHEVKIRSAFLNWQTEAQRAGARQPALTAEQQSELQDLLVARAVHLAEAESQERLSTTPVPHQFENEIRCVVESVAHEARDRWKFLTGAFHLEASAEGLYVDAERAIFCRVQELLRSPSDRVILQAWSAHEKRLQAKCEVDGRTTSVDAIPPENAAPGPSRPPSRVAAARPGTLGQKVERLRINKGMTIETLALEAGVDKKTVLRIINSGRRAHPSTLKKLSNALGVAASDLTDGP